MLFVFALLLVLPVGLEACSAPGAISDKDQPHALVSDGDDWSSVLQITHSHGMDVGLADFSATITAWTVPSVTNPLKVVRTPQRGVGVRWHRRFCRELC